ncbi:HI0074 family nucleotidyltransferase substrate-binding subunit [Persicobacter sp. CCB-QB2]|uniref:HI0074 family nucleotidyltransferase substrate-binding subunit n=1 Tax=Persicobacter sp. CCB-QB2 TaxID=1561025 RepID=UPI0006A9D077|nr:HI0074 family nucleotidyltransferase substrate-binding subunit [Persicobacter sp. CCB-QB2]
MELNFDRFRLSFARLDAQWVNFQKIDNTLPVITQEAIRESVIQRFEVCYDCLWKVLKKYMINELGVAEVPNSPKPILRLANENGLLEGDMERWMKYANARTYTSHDYSGAKAEDALKLIEFYIDDAKQLFEKMTGEKWK